MPFQSSLPAWQSLTQINNLFNQPLAWEERLAKIGLILIDTLQLEGVWLLTVSPLPTMAYGVVHTPLPNAPQAMVRIVDKFPPPPESWAPDSKLTDMLHNSTLYFASETLLEVDSELGEVLFETFNIRASVLIPLTSQGQVNGILALCAENLCDTENESHEICALLGHYLGNHLNNAHQLSHTTEYLQTIKQENKKLRRNLQHKDSQTDIINQLFTKVSAGQGLSETARLVLEQLQQLLDFQHLSISIVDETGKNIDQRVFDEYGSIKQIETSIPLNNSALAKLLDEAHGQLTPDLTQQPPAPDHQILLEDKVRAKMTVPFETSKGLRGSLNIGHHQAEKYTPQDLLLLEKITPQIATIIENARMFDAMEQDTNKLQLLNRLGEMLSAITELEPIVETTLSMLPRLLPGDVQALLISTEEGVHLGAAIPYGFNRTQKTVNEIIEMFEEVTESSLSTEILTTRQIAGNMPVSANWQPNNVLSLPLLTRQGIRGLIFLASGSEDYVSNDLLRIFSLIVSQVSAAVENATLFQQVEQESARLVAILSSSTDAILVVDRKGRVVLDNPAAWQVLGVESSQRGNLLEECTDNVWITILFEEAINGLQKNNSEIPLDDGRTFLANLSPVSVGESEVIGWVATMQDVSHFKELNELKNDFVNAVSHDLRSPLSSILLATYLFPQVGTVSDGQSDLLETISRKVNTMSQLVNDLLDVGKIEAGIDMDMELIPLTPIITEVISSLETQAKHKSITVEQLLKPNLPPVRGNPTRLNQVISNLIGNAIKYTPENGKVIVTTRLEEEMMQLQIRDTGLGIPAADQPHIFEKFYRVRGEHVKDIKGSGLGLAITKGIVEKHGGQISLDSTFGEGSTFTITLPLPHADE